MREKLALTIALGTAAVALALGGGGLAGAQGPVTVGPGGANVNVPGGPSVTVPTTACSDGVDNDGDGAVDLADPDCVSSAGTSEGTGPVQVPIPTTPPPAPAPPPAPSGGTQPGGGGGSGGGGTGVGGNVTPGSGNGVTPHQTINGITGGGNKGNGPGGVNGPGGNGPGKPLKPPPPYTANGPTVSNPTTTVGVFGPAPIGVPNFVIDSFEIPPFLLPLYQACGTEYGIPWPVLASINKIETAFGTNLNVSSAGAEGWMQFIPSTWAAYGVDANGDGREDPYNPVDAICAAARYLRAAGGQHDLYNAILAYNHADWYVQEVLLYARSYGKLPDDLVTSLTGLTEGAHFPVAADARYADDISTRAALRDSKPTARKTYGNAAEVVTSSPTRRGINIFSRRGAAVVAVNDGVIKAMGETKKLGKYVVLQDAYGNRYTYAELGHIIRVHPVPKPTKLTAADFKLVSPPGDKKPTAPASDSSTAITAGDAASAARRTEGDGRAHGAPAKKSTPAIHVHVDRAASHRHRLTNTEDMRPRLYALPDRPANRDRASLSGQINDLAGKHLPGYVTFRNYFNDVFGANSKNTELRPLRVGSKVIGGTVIGRIAAPVDGVAPHINFAIRPAGRGAPSIDPKPILDGWKLLEATAIYRASGKNPFASNLGVGQVLLMSKSALMRRVLSDPRLSIYSCGRNDIATGQIDRRVLAALEYLVEKGFRLTITSLECGHSILTTSGNVSNHSSGNAVDIAVINGIPVTGHQGPGSITDALLKTVLQLQGAMVPDELISLENLGGPSFALPDHYDHVHIGYTPLYGTGATNQRFVQLLKPDQWQRLIKRLGQIPNPTVPVHPSDASVPTKGAKKGKGGKGSGGAAAERASGAHIGE